MKEILSDLYDIILKIINNENYINIISIVVVAFTSYRVAKYSASKPEKLKIKQLQFKNVYLPLFRILSGLPDEPTHQQVLDVHERISYILNEHYELAFPQLHKHNSELQLIISHAGNPQNILSVMKHQVEVDYELLKKSLGYPSENFYNIFVRMTIKQKASFLVSWFNFLTLIGLFIIFVVTINHYPEHIAVIMLLFVITFLIYLFVGIRLSRWVDSLKY